MDKQFQQIVDDLKNKKQEANNRKTDLNDQANLVKSLDAVQYAVIKSISVLMRAMLESTLKTNVSNQITSISTPDALKASESTNKAIQELKEIIIGKDIDLSGVLTHLEGMHDVLNRLPTEYPSFPEMPTEMAVNNLNVLSEKLELLNTSINAIKLDPKIEIKAPEVNVEAPKVNITVEKDLKPLLDAVKAIKLPSNEKQLIDVRNAIEKTTKAINDLVFPVANFRTQDIVDAVNGISIASGSTAQTDVFNQTIIGTRNNQLEIDFSGTDPDSISLLTVTKTNGGDASTANGQAVFTTNTNTNGEIRAVTTRTVTYHPHSENYAAFTAIFTSGLANTFQRIGLYSDTNGFFIGYEGTSFGVTKRSNSIDNFTAQASFNVDTLTGQSGSKYARNGTPEALDTTKDNLYRIRYGWLGAAPIYYEILSPDGSWVTFHIIKHPNTVAVPTIEEPNQPLRVHIKKTTAGATNLSIKTACWAAGTSSDLQKITATLYNDTLAKTVRSVITGQTTAGGGGYVNVKVNPSGSLAVEGEFAESTYKTLIDETTTPSVTYLGKADIGTATSAASWRISKIDESGSVTSITWSGADFDAIWDNRATTVVYS